MRFIKSVCFFFLFLALNCNSLSDKELEAFSFYYTEISENDQYILKSACGEAYFNPLGTGILKAKIKNNLYDTILIDLTTVVCDSIFALDYEQSNEYKVINKDSIESYAISLRYLSKVRKRLIVLKHQSIEFYMFSYKNIHYDRVCTESEYRVDADSSGYKKALNFRVIYPFHLNKLKKAQL